MLKKRVYDILELSDESDKLAISVNIFIIVLICVSVVSIIFQSMSQYQNTELFFTIEIISVVVFTIEYILRLWSCTENVHFSRPLKGRLRYAITPIALIDLLAIVPFYLPFIFPVDLRILRMLRLIRILRVFKLVRYTKSFDLLIKVIRREKEALVITFFILCMILILASSLMYYAECDAQPEAFSSIPHAMWWAVASLTTVGYGDIYPITAIGKFLGSLIAIVGIGFIALPTGILTSGYVEELKKSSDEMNTTVTDIERIAALKENGHITEQEFEHLKYNILNEKTDQER